MYRWSRFVAGVWVLTLAGGASSHAEETGVRPAVAPDSGIVEQTRRRLVQLDVSVRGPRDVIDELRREDFELVIGGRQIPEFQLDSLCDLTEQEEPLAAAESSETVPPAMSPARVGETYLFYFDQHHLNMAGRARAIDLTRELIDELIVRGNRGMIVSNGKTLETFLDLTEDPLALKAALKRLEDDHNQWITFATYEDTRIEEILDLIERNDIERATRTARGYMREEQWLTDRALRRFSMVVGRLADLEPPKAVIYFADTMRSNAGAHYLGFFGSHASRPSGSQADAMVGAESSTFLAGHAFERVVEEATAHGVRLYPIQAEGLTASSLMARGSLRGGRPAPTGQRRKDAQDSLVSLAMESGGKAFLHGVRSKKIAQRIRDDLSCVYLLSFDASVLPADRSLPVRVRMHRPGVELGVRGSIVIQSESVQLTARLLAAFAAPNRGSSDVPVHAEVIGTGFEEGRYSALVQLVVPGSPLSVSSWDLGISLVSRGQVREDASGRIGVRGASVPVVFEKEIHFPPGPFELVGVAHEITANAISTGMRPGDWPNPNQAPATIGSITVMQPTEGAFLRDDQLRRTGPVAMAEDQPVRIGRPTALVSLICRPRKGRGSLQVERLLSGDSSLEFPPLKLPAAEDPCVQIRDLIPAGTMTPGDFRYEIRVSSEGEPLASAGRSFFADAIEDGGMVRAGDPTARD